MAGRFPLYTDADVRGPLIRALRSVGWDIDQMSYAQLVDAFEELARQDNPFALYPIIRIWPRH